MKGGESNEEWGMRWRLRMKVGGGAKSVHGQN